MFSTLPVKEVRAAEGAPVGADFWPYTVPSVDALLRQGLTLDAITVLVGENGAGKSVLIESIAAAYGFPVEGGSRWHQRDSIEGRSAFGNALQVVKGVSSGAAGLFFRAETVHSLAGYLAGTGSARGEQMLQSSHGESALELVEAHSGEGGLWIFDEPESGLSFEGQLKLLVLLKEHVDGGGQVVLCTHSPMLMNMAGARILEIGDWGIREVAAEDLEVLGHWRSFMQSPERYLRHLYR